MDFIWFVCGVFVGGAAIFVGSAMLVSKVQDEFSDRHKRNLR